MQLKKYLAGALLVPVSAVAQQAPNYQTAFDSVTQTFTSLMGLGLALAGVVIAGLVGLKLLKKIVSRAT